MNILNFYFKFSSNNLVTWIIRKLSGFEFRKWTVAKEEKEKTLISKITKNERLSS